MYKVGDKVYLSLRNIQIDKLNKKLDARAAKFIVLEIISLSIYKLDIPPEIYNIFNIDLLQPAAIDPLSSQVIDDTQPPVILIDNDIE